MKTVRLTSVRLETLEDRTAPAVARPSIITPPSGFFGPSSTLINFDKLPNGSNLPSAVQVSNQYAEKGVLFSLGNGGLPITSSPFFADPISGPNSLFTSEFGQGTSGAPIIIDFDDAKFLRLPMAVGLVFTDSSTNNPFTAKAYNQAGQVVDQITINTANNSYLPHPNDKEDTFIGLRSTAGISRVVVQPQKQGDAFIIGYEIDNVQFNGTLKAPRASVNSFGGAGVSASNAATGASVLVRYTVGDLEDPIGLAFVQSDGTATSGTVVEQLTISPDAIRNSGGTLALVNESPDNALKTGTHTLRVLAGSPLAAALADPDVGNVFAVIDPDTTLPDTREDNAAVFRGLFQASTGSRLVVRTGSASVDFVTVSGSSSGVAVSFSGLPIGSSPFSGATSGAVSASDLLVMTGDADDVIKSASSVLVPMIVRAGDGDDQITAGGGNDDLAGGKGGDTYFFPRDTGGNKTITDEDATAGALDVDSIDFLGLAAGVALDLSLSTSQSIGGGLALQVVDPEGIEVVYGTEFNDQLFGNNGKNAIIGRGGNDELDGRGDTDLLLGDTFNLKLPGWKDLINGLFSLNVPLLTFAPVGSGSDTIRGGDGLDVVFGGLGNDSIDGGAGGGLLLGDAFQVTASVGPSLDLGDLIDNPKIGWRTVLTWFGLPQAALTGGGNDTIVGGDGVEIVIGGRGDDTIDLGGGPADFAFGNEGVDRLDASASSFAVLIGGTESDTLLGPSSPTALGGLLVGDTFQFTSIPRLDLNFDLDNNTYQLSLSAGLIARGNGNDVLQSSGLINVLIGGDGNDQLSSAGAFTLALGDSFTLGAAITLNLHSLYATDTGLIDDVQLPGLSGKGDDLINVTSTVSLALGGSGKDSITAGPDARFTFLSGGDQDDTVRGGVDAFNVLVGGNHNDSLVGGSSADVIFGDGWRGVGGGLLPLRMSDLRDNELSAMIGFVPTGTGRDTIEGGEGFDILIGGSGDDKLNGGLGTNLMMGDAFTLTAGITISYSTLLADPFDSASFTIPFSLSGIGADQIIGGSNKDLAVGGAGNDVISTGSGIDALFGNDGDDILLAGEDNDLLFGGNGNDLMHGEGSTDILRGGVGRDLFMIDIDNQSIESTLWDYDPIRDR